LHAPVKSWWAGWHVVERHGGRIEAVVTLEVDVPRSWLRVRPPAVTMLLPSGEYARLEIG
jgi:hypothetical protein